MGVQASFEPRMYDRIVKVDGELGQGTCTFWPMSLARAAHDLKEQKPVAFTQGGSNEFLESRRRCKRHHEEAGCQGAL